jgi:hypothetical protein
MATEKPLDLFDRAIGVASNEELLAAWFMLVGEAASRIDNYAAAIEDGAPPDVLNEAVVFATRVEEQFGMPLARASDRVRNLWRDIRHGREYVMSLVEEAAVDAR